MGIKEHIEKNLQQRQEVLYSKLSLAERRYYMLWMLNLMLTRAERELSNDIDERWSKQNWFYRLTHEKRKVVPFPKTPLPVIVRSEELTELMELEESND